MSGPFVPLGSDAEVMTGIFINEANFPSITTFARNSGDGRLGHLLYRRERVRRLVVPRILHDVFAAGPRTEEEILAELPLLLDRVDAYIADGVLNGPELNAADFMVAPSIALILYRPDVLPVFEGRPALDLVDRLLPEPA